VPTSADAAGALPLSGRVALVTGASRGIGWATAHELACSGAHVVLNGRDPGLLEERAAELTATTPGGGTAIEADVRDPAAVSALYRRIASEHKRLDMLVANAGVLGDALVGMISEDLIEDTLAVNTAGTLRHLQAAARLMGRKGGGSIVLLSSIVGLRGNVGQVVYAASKAAVAGAALAAAKELAPKKIRVNAIAPGYINTRMISHLSPETHVERVGSIPMGRPGEAEEVAKAIRFLCSDDASYITGQLIGVDGGMVL